MNHTEFGVFANLLQMILLEMNFNFVFMIKEASQRFSSKMFHFLSRNDSNLLFIKSARVISCEAECRLSS